MFILTISSEVSTASATAAANEDFAQKFFLGTAAFSILGN